MKVIIFGAKGMLGSMLSSVFQDLSPLLLDLPETDITDYEQVRSLIKKERPQFIINAAAYTDVDAAETHRELAFNVNETGVKNLAMATKEIDATLIHYSTDYVFPGDNPNGYREDDPPGPAVNVYGDSKLAGERALAQIRPKFLLQRIAWLYGPNGKNFVQTMLSLGQRHQSISVVNDQWGSPTYTGDVAQATRQLIEKKYSPGIYHTVNSGRATWFDFAKKIFELSDQKADIKPTTSAEFPRPARRPQYSMLINTRGPQMRPWQSALDDYIRSM